MPKFERAIVVGASSGIGAELVRQLAADGTRVAVVARRADRLEALRAPSPDRILAYPHDVTDFDAVPALFQRITGDLGGLDLLVYASGVMHEVGADEFSLAKDKEMIDVNVTGAIAWLNQGAIRFRGAKRGAIVGIGSVAGDRGRQGNPVYNASKAALHTYLEALRNRLSKHGVTVATIKPGPVETEMTAHLHFRNAMSAEEAARRILAVADRNGEFYLKFAHRVAFYVLKRIPSPLFRRLKV